MVLTSASRDPVPGLASPLSEWAAAYGAPVSAERRFSDVRASNGRVTQFGQSLPGGTSLRRARAELRPLLPADAKVVSQTQVFNPRGSCVLVEVRSESLASALGRPEDGVRGQAVLDFASRRPDGISDRPADIDFVLVRYGGAVSPQNCGYHHT